MTTEQLKNHNIDDMITKARAAQDIFEKFDQTKVDQVVREIAKVVHDNAVVLARMAVDETGMGIFEDKVKKNQGKAKIIWNSLKGKKSVGIIDRDKETGVTKVAKPMGVIGAVTPTTNPIVTPMSNMMFALKGRNAIIIAPHPRAKACSTHTVNLVNKAIAKFNVPKNLVQIIEEPSIELTNELMQKSDVTVATGGMGMVKAAYSSGKPAFGVGAGNVQCILDRGIDIQEAVPKIIIGRTFDNGIICAGEQTVIAPRDEYQLVIDAFVENGAYYTDDANEVEAFRKVLFENGAMSKHVVGQSAEKIASLAGVKIPDQTKLILLKADGYGKKDLLCKEKMCPVMATFMYDKFEDAVEIAQSNLNLEGRGHTVALHSENIENIEYAGINLTVSRLVVNQTSATSAGGSFFNGFAPTTTLGCGSWGNNSISENLDYHHLINISRIGHFMKDSKVPSDEELWEV